MKTPLILLHGALGSADNFAPLIPVLSEKFEVLAFDLPGHGKSPAPVGGLTPDTCTQALNCAIEHHFPGDVPVSIFGYSMGGYIALLSAKEGNRRIGKILTLGTKMDWTPEIAAKEITMLDPVSIENKVPQFAGLLKQRHSATDWKQVLHLTAGFMEILGQTNPLSPENLQSVTVPVRYMLGDRDKMVSLDETVQAYQATPESSLAVLPGTPHPLEKVNPARLCAEIADFSG